MTKKCLIYVLSLFFSCTYATNDTLMLQIFVYVFTCHMGTLCRLTPTSHGDWNPKQSWKTHTKSWRTDLSIPYKLFQISQSNFTHLRKWHFLMIRIIKQFEARNLQPEDHDRGVQLLWKNSDVRSKLTCLDFQYHSGLSVEDTLTNWHSRMVAFFFRDKKPPKNIQLPSLMLTMQVVANTTWFWECNQIIQNDSV